jgi:DNA-binding winged helix-turn-helix (wHTH) protein
MPSSRSYPPSSRMVLGPLRIDLQRETVEVDGDGDGGGLTPRAEQLLLLLARYPNLLVTREQILDTVWAGRVVEDAAISHCVWQIRRLLGEDGKKILQTRSRRGYLLVVGDDDWSIETEWPGETATDDETQAVDLRKTDTDDIATPPSVDFPAAGFPAADSPSADFPSGDSLASVSPASVPSAVAVPVAGTPRSWRRRGLLALLVIGVFATTSILLLTRRSDSERAAPVSSDRIALTPQAELKLALSVPADLNWLRASLLRDIVDHAYLRGGSVVLFQSPPQNDPFAGPLLRIDVAAGASGDIVADLTLTGDGRRAQRKYSGPPSELRAALDALLDARLLPAKRRSTPATDALVAGLMNDLTFDGLAAIGEYRRALGLDPTSIDTQLAMAQRLLLLGDSLEVERLVGRMKPDAAWSDRQRCGHALLIADIAPERLARDACEAAQIRVLLNPGGAGEARRRLASMAMDRRMGASAWLQSQAMAVEARQYLGEHSEAEGVSIDAERIADAAGWRWARWRLAAERCKSVLYTGRNAEGVRLCEDSADGLEASGDGLSALAPRIFALKMQRPEPGPATTAQRSVYRGLVDRARTLGSPSAEVSALDGMIALDRDDSARWSADKTRIETIIAQDYAPAMRTRVRRDLITEDIARRQYRSVLAKLAESDEPADALGPLYMRAQALFALDDVPGAIVQIDAMEKRGYDIAETNPCLFAWLFVETGDAGRARVILKGCPFEEWDPASIAGLRGDWGLLARAGLHRLADEPQWAWPTVKPRIEALSSASKLGRLEAEALAFLARHATEMPGADFVLLQRALDRTSALAGRDGAGPNLRFGTHVLNWRLCRAKKRVDCGPVLPEWAQDDRFEARLAMRFAAGLTSER